MKGVRRMNDILQGRDAVRAMNCVTGTTEEDTNKIWRIAIDGNIEQLREEFLIDNAVAEEMTAAIHECADSWGLDEHANDNSELYNMINAAMRMFLMIYNAERLE